ncbi:MAG: YdiU family protein, partial [Bdellovibrionales bacterium]|nr:YdiU family protein [Bdellovibrionales bacterium]
MISKLVFQHRLIRNLPGEILSPTPSRQTPGIFYAETSPTPVSHPELLIWSPETAALLDLPPTLTREDQQVAARVFSGNEILPGSRPYSTRYGGHQFGVWAGQLGDGRAIHLGEVQNSRGEFWDVQLKGAGPTPYSRTADGRAVLRSSLREFLCSEAMHHLGIPTTRALCCVTTGDPVVRDMFYDGNPQEEPGAITTRVAPSFLRLGHFEILAANDEIPLLNQLVSTSIVELFPELAKAYKYDATQPLPAELVLQWFQEICQRTSQLMVEWQRVGFVHGVMNTDNLSLLGLTIDYGPYGWLDGYDPEWTPNTTDFERRRYRFGHQPSIAQWNLSRFAGALIPVFSDTKEAISKLEAALSDYRAHFAGHYLVMRARKLGFHFRPEDPLPLELQGLMNQLDELLILIETDMTLFYRLLSKALDTEKPLSPEKLFQEIRECFYLNTIPENVSTRWTSWLKDFQLFWLSNVQAPASRRKLMDSVNPFFVLRNYLVQESLDALETNNRAPLDALMLALKTPYEENSFTQAYFQRRPDWARERPGCSALSC